MAGLIRKKISQSQGNLRSGFPEHAVDEIKARQNARPEQKRRVWLQPVHRAEDYSRENKEGRDHIDIFIQHGQIIFQVGK
jgi:hypothetical protein